MVSGKTGWRKECSFFRFETVANAVGTLHGTVLHCMTHCANESKAEHRKTFAGGSFFQSSYEPRSPEQKVTLERNSFSAKTEMLKEYTESAVCKERAALDVRNPDVLTMADSQ